MRFLPRLGQNVPSSFSFGPLDYSGFFLLRHSFLVLRSPSHTRDYTQVLWSTSPADASLPAITAAHQAFWSITNYQSLLKPMSIESVIPSSHLILCPSLLLLPPIPPSIRVIHFEFIFVYSVRKCSSFILLQVVDQFSQHYLLKRLSFLHCIFLPPLSKIRCP